MHHIIRVQDFVMIPKTSITLLNDLKKVQSYGRWTEFVARYRPMMSAYLSARFPQLDKDELIQETLIALHKALPKYQYSPDEKGHFHNYLTGILRRRALRVLAAQDRSKRQLEVYANEPHPLIEAASEQQEWRTSLFEIALQQLLVSTSIQERTKQIFIRVTLGKEKPESVAEAFGISRNAVDQIKSRIMGHLRKLVVRLEKVEELDV